MAKLKKETIEFLNKNFKDKIDIPLNQKKDSIRQSFFKPKKNEVADWLNHKIKQDQTQQTMASENEKYTRPIVNNLRVASALGQFSPNPIVKFPSMAINSTIGFSDAYKDLKEGDTTEAIKDAAFALPLGLLSEMKKITPGIKLTKSKLLSPELLKLLGAWELAGATDDIKQSTENGKTN
jgi:hypothetical protein